MLFNGLLEIDFDSMTCSTSCTGNGTFCLVRNLMLRSA